MNVDAMNEKVKVNEDGQQKAVERIEELTEIPRYRRQEPAAQQEDTDPIPPTNAPETPPEDE